MDMTAPNSEIGRSPTCVDVFCGMGGFSVGFKAMGFAVSGIDLDAHAVRTYHSNLGDAERDDVRKQRSLLADVIVGGPPCRPWSVLNLSRRGAAHPDYSLLEAFGELLTAARPLVFAMENVPGLRKDQAYDSFLTTMSGAGYTCEPRIVNYSTYGAASTRRRLVTLGVLRGSVLRLWERIEACAVDRPRTVGDAIHKYQERPGDGLLDHHWPALRTIAKYADKYASGQFGWYRLAMDRQAPSFGNIMKTYTLHPNGENGDARVLSPREAMAILGFEDAFVFPEGVPISAKYRMIADAVSPAFSLALATAVRETLSDSEG